jgi:HSP20 family protein
MEKEEIFLKRYSNYWFPPMDVYETEDEFIVKIEIPGMRKEEFRITFNDGILTIQGERNDDSEALRYMVMEINYGEFERRIRFKEPINQKGIKAFYKNGFLKVVLPKRKR